MSYCRFTEGDVYMYASRDGIECCLCSLAPLVPSLLTNGTSSKHPLFPNVPACQHCQGHGCKECMVHGSQTFATIQAAYEHLIAHRQAGHKVPPKALAQFIEEGAQPFESETTRAT